jgi:hypothetical protein
MNSQNTWRGVAPIRRSAPMAIARLTAPVEVVL